MASLGETRTVLGGFDERAHQAYIEVRGNRHGPSLRLYQLYPLLVHVNLFGGSYVGRADDVITHFAG